MILNLDGYEIALVISPVDGRSGFDKLACIARTYCGIDVDEKSHVVVFVSRRYSVCKVILRDEHGKTMITRWLDEGRFERFLQREDGNVKTFLTKIELEKFLDGAKIQHFAPTI